jgi:hypothetical protein
MNMSEFELRFLIESLERKVSELDQKQQRANETRVSDYSNLRRDYSDLQSQITKLRRQMERGDGPLTKEDFDKGTRTIAADAVGYKAGTAFPKIKKRSKPSLQAELDNLADYILAEIPGEPRRNEGAAIRLLKRYREALQEIVGLLERHLDLENTSDVFTGTALWVAMKALGVKEDNNE